MNERTYVAAGTVISGGRPAVSDIATRSTTFGPGLGQTFPAHTIQVLPTWIVDAMTRGGTVQPIISLQGVEA